MIHLWQVYSVKKDRYSYKCYRVFASNDKRHGRLLKVKNGKNGEKFANTPDHCFINNENICDERVPDILDKQWYINLARKRLEDFGICCTKDMY